MTSSLALPATHLAPMLSLALLLPLGAAAEDLAAITVKGQALESGRAAYSVPTLGREEIRGAGVSEV